MIHQRACTMAAAMQHLCLWLIVITSYVLGPNLKLMPFPTHNSRISMPINHLEIAAPKISGLAATKKRFDEIQIRHNHEEARRNFRQCGYCKTLFMWYSKLYRRSANNEHNCILWRNKITHPEVVHTHNYRIYDSSWQSEDIDPRKMHVSMLKALCILKNTRVISHCCSQKCS